MKNNVYSIHDQLACSYSPLYEAPNDGVAIRSFLHSLSKGDTADPRDYVLYKLGSFDTAIGQLEIVEPIMVKRGEVNQNG